MRGRTGHSSCWQTSWWSFHWLLRGRGWDVAQWHTETWLTGESSHIMVCRRFALLCVRDCKQTWLKALPAACQTQAWCWTSCALTWTCSTRTFPCSESGSTALLETQSSLGTPPRLSELLFPSACQVQLLRVHVRVQNRLCLPYVSIKTFTG